MKRQGFVLVLSLILAVFLFVVGIGYLGLKANQYRSVAQAQLATQAKALAEAGLEDFRIKLQLDREFPPNPPEDGLYSYREQLVAGGKVRGSYSVTIDTTYALPPYFILIVTLTGEVGTSAQAATARRTLRAEVDIAEFLRSDGTTVNPNFRRIINVRDLGGS